jgi:hypothetical protein
MACRVLIIIIIIIIHIGNIKKIITFSIYIFDMTHFKTFDMNKLYITN